VIAAFAVMTLSFAALGILLGSLMPTARAAQGLGVLLFFVFMMLGGAGPPREVLPAAMGRIGDVLPMTHAARLVRDPWLTETWDWGALAVMVGILVASAALTAWRWRAE
jgi:ABC-2 type transport system permease protein